MSPCVVLIGPPGAGKTTVGRLLAANLQLGFRDTDDVVAVIAGKSVSDIFVEDGESRFRELEASAVGAALGEHDGVLALGGGAVLAESTQQALQGHSVVFLDVDLSSAAKRVGFNRDRPLLLGNPRAQWLALMEKRRPVYERLATVRVETSARTPDEVAEMCRKELGL